MNLKMNVMITTTEELIIPTLGSIKKLLEPIYLRLEKIDTSIQTQNSINQPKKYYRNQDLKKIFGLSSNTIIKYREVGVLPYTKLGDIFLYEIKNIDKILSTNKVEI
jgi:hypothetical protein